MPDRHAPSQTSAGSPALCRLERTLSHSWAHKRPSDRARHKLGPWFQFSSFHRCPKPFPEDPPGALPSLSLPRSWWGAPVGPSARGSSRAGALCIRGAGAPGSAGDTQTPVRFILGDVKGH